MTQTRDAPTLASRQRLVGGQVAESNRRIFALQQSVVPEYDILRPRPRRGQSRCER